MKKYFFIVLPFLLFGQEKFSLIILPDTQHYSSSLWGGKPDYFYQQTKWIVENRKALNIAYVIHLGDIVQNYDSVEHEWMVADTAISILEQAKSEHMPNGIPFGLAVGNHDKNLVKNEAVFYNKYFGVDRFQNRSYYGGHYKNNNNNHFDRIDVNGVKMLIIYVEYDEQMDPGINSWADSLLHEYEDHFSILVSHYLIIKGNTCSPGRRIGNQGTEIYDRLKSNRNLRLMLCGHDRGEALRVDSYKSFSLYTFMANFQDYPNGGNGWLRILECVPNQRKLNVKTYSPVLNEYQNDCDSEFSLNINFNVNAVVNENKLGSDKSTNEIQSTVYPNPFNGEFRLEIRSQQQQFVDVYLVDLLGKKIPLYEAVDLHEGVNPMNIKLKDISTGVYLLKIESGGKAVQNKVVYLK